MLPWGFLQHASKSGNQRASFSLFFKLRLFMLKSGPQTLIAICYPGGVLTPLGQDRDLGVIGDARMIGMTRVARVIGMIRIAHVELIRTLICDDVAHLYISLKTEGSILVASIPTSVR